MTTLQTFPVHYKFDFVRFHEHLVDVSLTFESDSDAPSLWMPAWIPGSYLIREFARHITAVHYQVIDSQDGETSSLIRAKKTDKHTWQLLKVRATQTVSVHYEVYCYDLSVRTAYVDNQRLYGNFTSLALAIEGQETSAIQVSLVVPEAFLADKQSDKVVIACGLDATLLVSSSQSAGDSLNTDLLGTSHVYGLQADSYHHLIDYPFEIAEQDKFDFIIQDQNHEALAHQFYLSGRHSANLGRLQQDLTQICQSYVNWLGDAPFSAYTFMTYASGQDYGGLEHISSTSLITPRRDLPNDDELTLPSADYQRFLGLCSHEYFHAWWVKTVQPDVMFDVDLRHEAFTPLLWVFEGFTSYVDDFMLQASGVIDRASYLKLLAEQINRYYQTYGRANQSVAESSYDAWIKLYRSDENTGNAGISYYNKGALVALCLDLTLLKQSDGRYRLFDVIKAFYEQAKMSDKQRIGITSADMSRVISQFMPVVEWQIFEQRYIDGVDELPLDELLAVHGISINPDSKDTADKQVPWGMRCTDTPAGLKVNRVQRGSRAAIAGISAHDVIIAIEDIKADSKQLATVKNAQHKVDCHLFRRDELRRITVLPNVAQSENDMSEQSVFPHKVHLQISSTEALTKGHKPSKPDEQPAWQEWLEVMNK
ncbi:M61 family metallopeptidase [Psychrobacter sp. DM4]|uniref:M61 family metallopeptidase n=1 Tax=Psychrobacter sp. DM4 TaxID=3440637 RepID=UPI003F503D51